jgi:hypothetical protein
MDKLTWHIEEVKWSDLKPFSHNARKIKAENKKNLLDSINEFGMTHVISSKSVIEKWK